MLKLSVIIPTVNRERLLKQTLDSIERQTLPKSDFEIIVVDNGSPDNTRQVCDEYNKRNGNLRYFYDPRPGLHVGRNKGYQESRSDILVYADDDIIAFPTWLKAIYDGFQNKDVKLIGGSNLPRYEASHPVWLDSLWDYHFEHRCRIIETHSIIDIRGNARQIDPTMMVAGCNLSVRKSVIREAKGFHPDGMPDCFLGFRGDGEVHVLKFIKENGYLAKYIPEASVYHVVTENRVSLDYVKKVSYRTGISDAYSMLRSNDHAVNDLYRILLKEKVQLFKSDKANTNNIIKNIRKTYYYKGQLFLYKLYWNDLSVREWIHREDYFDTDVREIK